MKFTYSKCNNLQFTDRTRKPKEYKCINFQIMVLSKDERFAGNKILSHQVHESFVKRINICIANYGKHIEGDI